MTTRSEKIEAAARTLMSTRGLQYSVDGVQFRVVDDTAARHLGDALALPPPEPRGQEPKTCSRCGRYVKDGYTCRNCGAVPREQEPQPDEEAKPRAGKDVVGVMVTPDEKYLCEVCRKPATFLNARCGDHFAPHLDEATVERVVASTLAFFRGVIKCGEPWTSHCEREYQNAIAALAAMRKE